MLPSVNVLKNNILGLSPSMSNHQASVNLIDVVANFMDQVQAGATGSPGIFTDTRPPSVAVLETQAPVLDNSWIPNFADAIEAGVLAGIITPGTVTNAAWIGSGGSDVVTVPSAAATIITLSAAKAVLISALASVNAQDDPPMALAQAIHDYVSAFTFLCIGLGPPPPLAPIPIPFGAQ